MIESEAQNKYKGEKAKGNSESQSDGRQEAEGQHQQAEL